MSCAGPITNGRFALRDAVLLGRLPGELVVIEVGVDRTDLGAELSEPVAATIPGILRAVQEPARVRIRADSP